ncbi:MAG: hypothetical protein GXO91_04740 [FCB group bacterium]|nr:hypothetical protein [FCB group bacterium]
MSKTYTPGLKILAHTTVRKVRQLPLKGKVHKKKNDHVEPDSIVASTSIPGNVQMVNVAQLLNIEPDAVSAAMKVKIDEPLKKGKIIAENNGIFGFFKSAVKSPIDGTLANVSDVTGQVILSEPPVPIEVDAYTSGKVVDILPEEGLIIETEAALIQGILGIGGESRGKIEVIVSSPDQELTSDMLNDSQAGKILVGGSFITYDTFQKASQFGVAAIVIGGFNYTDLSKLLGYPLGVAITGSEELGTSLIITEGFGRITMASRTFNLLKKHDGNFAAVNGATQIRAGVIRPEVLVPLEASDENPTKLDETDLAISKGTTVRVIRSPRFGEVGTVVGLPSPLTKMESETMVRVAEIKFKDGEVKTIPRANLEIIVMDK